MQSNMVASFLKDCSDVTDTLGDDNVALCNSTEPQSSPKTFLINSEQCWNGAREHLTA